MWWEELRAACFVVAGGFSRVVACRRVFSSCGLQEGFLKLWHGGGYSLVAVCGLLIVVASLVAEHRLLGTRASTAAAHGLSSCGAHA